MPNKKWTNLEATNLIYKCSFYSAKAKPENQGLTHPKAWKKALSQEYFQSN